MAVFVIVTLIVIVWLFINISSDAKHTLNQANQMATTTLATTTTSAASAPVSPAFILVHAPKGSIHAEVSATEAIRERGLSGRTSLSKDSGMLFVFPNAGVYGFWMKDMHIALDMIWISADQKVVGVTPGVTPETYPEIFYPPADVVYVLEVPSGTAAEYGITTGTVLSFPTR